MPGAKRAPAAPPAVGGIVDALDQLERRRRAKAKPKTSSRRGDLDLDGIR